jgi:YjjG family noncanonical pyrimidine nucleotidase
MYRHLFFDADGTLFDFDRAEQQAFALMAQELSLPSDESAFARYKSCNEECWKLFEKGMVTLAQLKTQRFDRFFSSLSLEGDSEKASASYQYHLSGQGILFEQSIKVLQVLTERGYTLYLASNGIADVQRGRIAHAKIGPYFKGIYISEELGVQKPDTRFFEQMLGKEQLLDHKKSCLMIGDSLSSDIKGGIDSGLDTVWINAGNQEPQGVVPTYTLTHLGQLLQLLSSPI